MPLPMGTAGRIENSQVAVYRTYAGTRGHALIDRELYLPQSWTDDPVRCAAAGVPAEVGFATKPALATAMLTGALDAGVPARWVADDEVYGADPGLRAALETRVFRLPAYAHELNPVEPVWAHLKRSLANLTEHTIAELTALVKTRLKRMQYRPGLLVGFLAGTGLEFEPFL